MELPEGWKLVPIEPTQEMRIAYFSCVPDRASTVNTATQKWSAMLAAAPQPPAPKNPWKDALAFECEAVNVPFNEESPDDTLMRLMNHYEYMEQESPQS